MGLGLWQAVAWDAWGTREVDSAGARVSLLICILKRSCRYRLLAKKMEEALESV